MNKKLNVLTIGNSFADSAVRAIVPLAKFVGKPLHIAKANFGGCELRRHWSYIEAEINNPADCRIYPMEPLSKILEGTSWDIVTIQQASHESWRPETFQPYAENIFNFIKEHAPKAEVVIQQTWAYRLDHPQFKPGSDWGISQAQMYNRLTVNYKKLAKELGGLRIIPTGYAVQMARKQQPVQFRMLSDDEADALRYPDIPPQAGALVGKDYYIKDDDTKEFIPKTDRIHLNARGEYLQGMVWLGMLFGCDVSGIEYLPDFIGREDAAFLRKISQMAIEKAADIPENC